MPRLATFLRRIETHRADAVFVQLVRAGRIKMTQAAQVRDANTAFVAGTGGIMSEQVALVLGGD